MISLSAIIYLLLIPISYFNYQKLKKQNNDNDNYAEDDSEDIL
jgi:CDP-diacylglycerol--serine O-phosphatidyltransferase